ncbi:MAG: ribulose-phosphate 3-epimerase [Candidatus Humimicrobiaceae bacterium]
MEKKQIKIAASILNYDFYNLSGQIAQVEEAGVDMLHLDIMDGNFVPNLSIGPGVVSSLKKNTNLFLDVHLMVSRPEMLIGRFIDSGADLVTIHAEASPHIERLLSTIKEAGVKAGIALNPSTPICVVENVLHLLDLILIMTVNPGFGGQKFIYPMLDKIKKTNSITGRYGKQKNYKRAIEIQVDGGIGAETAPKAVKAGANVLVMGTAICQAEDPKAFLGKIREDITKILTV